MFYINMPWIILNDGTNQGFMQDIKLPMVHLCMLILIQKCDSIFHSKTMIFVELLLLFLPINHMSQTCDISTHPNNEWSEWMGLYLEVWNQHAGGLKLGKKYTYIR